jgi:hypothetical protein
MLGTTKLWHRQSFSWNKSGRDLEEEEEEEEEARVCQWIV